MPKGEYGNSVLMRVSDLTVHFPGKRKSSFRGKVHGSCSGRGIF